MEHRIDDPDVQMLADIAGTLKCDYVPQGIADPWAGSPFAWIHPRPTSSQVGKIAKEFVARWCRAKGLEVARSGDSQADLLVARRRVEIKYSCLWASGDYRFQQIRDQDYEFVLCLGLSPFNAQCWVIPKKVALQYAIPQHTGRGGRDTRWLSFPAAYPPIWLQEFGGKLADAYRILSPWQRAQTPR